MSEAESIENRSRPYAKQSIIGACLLVAALAIVFYTSLLPVLRVPLAFLIPIALIYGLWLALNLYHLGNADLPIVPFLVGTVFVAGGAALDGIATLIKTPTLAQEANPIARALLDSGQPTGLVIAYGVVTQILLVLLTCTLWAAFLRHRKVLIESARSKSPKSSADFVKAAFGAAHLSWRQYFLPLKFSELPTAYHTAWAMTVLLVGGSLYRWHLGLSWLNIVRWTAVAALVISVLLATVGYIAWLLRQYSKGAIGEQAR